MIQLTPHMRILSAVEPVDFRKGIDGLAELCRVVLRSDPFGGRAIQAAALMRMKMVRQNVVFKEVNNGEANR